MMEHIYPLGTATNSLHFCIQATVALTWGNPSHPHMCALSVPPSRDPTVRITFHSQLLGIFLPGCNKALPPTLLEKYQPTKEPPSNRGASSDVVTGRFPGTSKVCLLRFCPSGVQMGKQFCSGTVSKATHSSSSKVCPFETGHHD